MRPLLVLNCPVVTLVTTTFMVDGLRTYLMGVWTCPYLPGHVPHFRHHYIILQGGTRLFISLWPVWRHSMEMYLWETFSGDQMLSSESPDIEEWLMGGSLIIQSDGAWIFYVVIRGLWLGVRVTLHIMFTRISDFVPEEWAQLAGSMLLVISSLLQRKFAVLPVLMLESPYLNVFGRFGCLLLGIKSPKQLSITIEVWLICSALLMALKKFGSLWKEPFLWHWKVPLLVERFVADGISNAMVN